MNTSISSPEAAVRPRGPGQRRGHVVVVRDSLVVVEVNDRPIVKNEVGYVINGDQRLKGEVLRVQGETADMQVFESTQGVRVGDEVELTGELLSAELGPGLLGQVVDGLENPLQVMAQQHGFFLPRGVDISPLDRRKSWRFTPVVRIGDSVGPGEPVGVVPEGPFSHKILTPFDQRGKLEVNWIRDGSFTVDEPVARLRLPDGGEKTLTMVQRWPVRRAIPAAMLRSRAAERLYPSEPLTTTIRIIDTFFPIAQGGTACIPGPFGAGKTVLQGLIARYSSVDIVVIVACGERAGEVVETITEYPEMHDPHTGGSLMDRTIIVCNTSSMPVAARESSIYTGLTLAEYYRQMGYNVLLIADSTSRWAQAMRETSGRMEEIPGEEAYPAHLDSSIKNVYERAGVIRCPDGSIGSLTMVGTVSPAGGNFEEPVTQATLASVKTFLGLSYDRAYRRYYPAIDPLTSWSRYLNQLEPWYSENIDPQWTSDVSALQRLLEDGDQVYQMMQVAGEEGITMEDFVTWQKATLLDMVFLQQDAFDEVDVSTSRERQVASLRLLSGLIEADFQFESKDAVQEFFTRLTGLYKNMNYSRPDSREFRRYLDQISELTGSQART